MVYVLYDAFQEVMSHRNAGFLSAVNALEETSAAEGVLRCMRYVVRSSYVVGLLSMIICIL